MSIGTLGIGNLAAQADAISLGVIHMSMRARSLVEGVTQDPFLVRDWIDISPSIVHRVFSPRNQPDLLGSGIDLGRCFTIDIARDKVRHRPGALREGALGGASARAGIEDTVAAAGPAVAVLEVARADREELAGQGEGGQDAAADPGLRALKRFEVGIWARG